MTFYVGQKVVCIRDDWFCLTADNSGPVKGDILTVKEVKRDGDWVGLSFVEKSWATSNGESYFVSDYFRPVVERKTDISIFTALLDPANHKQLEGV